MTRESMQYDVVIVGAGPAGLAASIRLKQKARDLSVCVLEKGSSVGAHILSGAVIETSALDELFPNWKTKKAPLNTQVKQDHFLYLTEKKAFCLPTPKSMQNKGNYIVSLAKLCQWLAEQALELGVEIYPGFAATELLFDEHYHVKGVATNPVGLDKDGQPTERYQPGIEIYGKQTLLGEGCRGALSESIIHRFGLRKKPQSYGIGIKERWKIDPINHKLGKVVHTVGWPLDKQTYGGSFLYHTDDYHLSVGFVVGLDYKNPYLDPFQELQRFKKHPAISPLFENAERIEYGARALNEGGFQAIPQLSFPGGLLIGDAAGFLNVPKLKGTHNAMKSGILAADALVESKDKLGNIIDYAPQLKKSTIWKELSVARNIRPAFKWGLLPGLIYAGIDQYIFQGRAPWTFSLPIDHQTLKPASDVSPIDYPKPDGKISFDKLSSLYLSNTYHEENQPGHLKLHDPQAYLDVNLKTYAAPEQHYCPANVYEIVDQTLQINAQNCLHCKTCDIKDPLQQIKWTSPEGGGGPNYGEM